MKIFFLQLRMKCCNAVLAIYNYYLWILDFEFGLHEIIFFSMKQLLKMFSYTSSNFKQNLLQQGCLSLVFIKRLVFFSNIYLLSLLTTVKVGFHNCVICRLKPSKFCYFVRNKRNFYPQQHATIVMICFLFVYKLFQH